MRIALACMCAYIVLSATAFAGVADDAFSRSTMSSSMKSAISALGSTPVYSLPIPVVGVALNELRDTWGDARSAGRTHKGVDIFADRGTAVISPTDAVIGSIGYGSTGGNFIFTINPGQERYYFAHLDSVVPGLVRGDSVSKGDIIGYVGNTGNATHANPHLHFTIYAPKAINPYQRLAYVFAHDVVPVVGTGYVGTLPSIDLEDGDEGAAVRTLQLYLLNNSEGQARNRLERAGTTGYFGSITKNALAEYQRNNGISPASGYFGRLSRAHMNESALWAAFTRDLEKGMKGDDVLALQKYLNSNGYLVSSTGAGSPGNETEYFGTATQRALIEFQREKGISPSAGYFGPRTRKHIDT